MTPSLALTTALAVAAVLLSLWAPDLVAVPPRPAAPSASGRELAGERAVARAARRERGPLPRARRAGRRRHLPHRRRGAFRLREPRGRGGARRRGGELLGRAFLEVVRPDYREHARRFYEDQRQQGIPNTYCEFPMLGREGEDLWVGQRAQLVSEDGRFAGLQAVARNITERKLVQQAIAASGTRTPKAKSD